MTSKEFKNAFGNEAKTNGFSRAFGGWYLESNECIAILELQKSSYSDYFYLKIKIYVKGAFNRQYSPNKDLMNLSAGHINSREYVEYYDVLNFDEPMDDLLRLNGLEDLFKFQIVPFVFKSLTREGIIILANNDKINLLSSVKDEIIKLSKT